MKNKDTINVYWAPARSHISQYNSYEQAWELLYPDPSNLYSELAKNKVRETKMNKTFFACPAVNKNFQNTFVFKNILDSEYTIDINNPKILVPDKVPFLSTRVDRDPIIKDGPTIILELSYIFFADEDLNAYFSGPVFHKAGYTNYGSIIPGSFNIGSWFRTYNIEIQMWSWEGRFIIRENEPIFYANFMTDKKIKLHRFKYTNEIDSYALSCTNSTSNIKTMVPLYERYQMFKNARMKENILREIKKNLLEENNE